MNAVHAAAKQFIGPLPGRVPRLPPFPTETACILTLPTTAAAAASC